MSVIRTRLLALAIALVTPVVFAAEKPNVDNGKTIFEQRCGICHSITKEGGPIMGPNLLGLFGRKAAGQKDFQMYTAGLKDYGVKWNDKTLDVFLKDPMGKVPGTQMIMPLPDAKERADVIAYLATLK